MAHNIPLVSLNPVSLVRISELAVYIGTSGYSASSLCTTGSPSPSISLVSISADIGS